MCSVLSPEPEPALADALVPEALEEDPQAASAVAVTAASATALRERMRREPGRAPGDEWFMDSSSCD
jgi:hypothetical protein